MRLTKADLYAESLLYIAAGINHFWHESFYVGIMPDHYSHPAQLVQLTGLAEIAGGLGLLFPPTRRAAAAGLILMLAGYLDVHIYMLENADRFPQIPKWTLWARLPLQAVLMAWAWKYARRNATRESA